MSVLGVVDVGVAVHHAHPAAVVVIGDEMPGRHRLGRPHRIAQSQHAQHDQHGGHDQLEPAAHRRRDRELQPDDDGAHDRQGRHMAGAPEHSDQRAAGKAPLAREDRRDRDQMVWIRRVLQTEEKAEEDRRDRRGIQERGHSDILRRRPVRRARWIAARNAQWASAA